MAKHSLTEQELQLVSHLKLKRARVPLKTCLKLSLKNMWKKKFRYLVMFLICTLSLTFFSVTIELNGEKYYPRADGTTRIKIADTVTNLLSLITTLLAVYAKLRLL